MNGEMVVGVIRQGFESPSLSNRSDALSIT